MILNSIDAKKKTQIPRVGVGIFVFNNSGDKFLLGKRLKENKEIYGLVGGSLELFETFERCAQRELLEETGINIPEISRFASIACFNCISEELGYHWIDCYVIVNLTSEEETKLSNPEPDKCCGWIWYTFDEMMKMHNNLFYPLIYFLNRYEIKNIEDIKNLKVFK